MTSGRSVALGDALLADETDLDAAIDRIADRLAVLSIGTNADERSRSDSTGSLPQDRRRHGRLGDSHDTSAVHPATRAGREDLDADPRTTPHPLH